MDEPPNFLRLFKVEAMSSVLHHYNVVICNPWETRCVKFGVVQDLFLKGFLTV